MAVDVKLMTVEELEAMPDDGRRVELVRGELIEMPPTGYRHGRLLIRLGSLLESLIEDGGLGTLGGDVGVVISRDPATVLAPDIAVYLGNVVAPNEEPEGYRERLPDIAIEIVSPSDTASEVHDTLRIYLEAGVRMVIAVWPKRDEVTISSPDGTWRSLTVNDVLDLSALAPGVTIPVSAIFRRRE